MKTYPSSAFSKKEITKFGCREENRTYIQRLNAALCRSLESEFNLFWR